MDENNDLDDLPEDQTSGFPTGVAEVTKKTSEEMDAFIHGIDITQSLDVTYSSVFNRDELFVIRVKVGNWSE